MHLFLFSNPTHDLILNLSGFSLHVKKWRQNRSRPRASKRNAKGPVRARQKITPKDWVWLRRYRRLFASVTKAEGTWPFDALGVTLCCSSSSIILLSFSPSLLFLLFHLHFFYLLILYCTSTCSIAFNFSKMQTISTVLIHLYTQIRHLFFWFQVQGKTKQRKNICEGLSLKRATRNMPGNFSHCYFRFVYFFGLLITNCISFFLLVNVLLSSECSSLFRKRQV